MSNPKLSSKIWNFFTINAIDESKANCDLCKEKLTRGGTNARSYGTSSLINHLRSFHHDEYELYRRWTESSKRQRDEEDKKTETKKQKQGIDIFMEKNQKMTSLGPTNPRTHAITKAIGEMIATDTLPFQIVEAAGFCRLMKLLEPRYRIPSSVHFSRKVIPDMYFSVKAVMAEMLAKARYVSFTSDAWTSDNNLHSFLSLTAHWIDNNWERQCAFLQLRLFEGSHTGEMLAAELLSIMEEWNIVGDRRGILVRDNGANMVKAARVAKITDLGCYIHTLQLIVAESLKTHRTVKDMIAVARSIVEHFRHSSKATEHLNEIQDSLNSDRTNVTTQFTPAHRLVLDIATRWNSTFYLLERLLEQKRAIGIYNQGADIKCLTANQWNLAEKVIHILKPFEEQTKQASLPASHAGMIIPSFRLLDRFLTRTNNPGDDMGVQAMRKEMCTDLHARLDRVMTDKTCVLATVLDPTYKLRFFVNDEATGAREMLLQEAMKEIRHIHTDTAQSATVTLATVVSKTITASQSTAEQQPLKLETEVLPDHSDINMIGSNRNNSGHGAAATTSSILDDFWQDFSDESSLVDSTSHEAACLKELNSYLAEPLQPHGTGVAPQSDPTEYWKINQHKYPVLASCARRYLATPASSVESECSFGSAGDICEDTRLRLSPDKLEQLLFLKKNLSVINFDYC